jgi:hypothetical protein
MVIFKNLFLSDQLVKFPHLLEEEKAERRVSEFELVYF